MKNKNIPGNCPFNPGVDCDQKVCARCGWNPAVDSKRKKELQEQRAMEAQI